MPSATCISSCFSVKTLMSENMKQLNSVHVFTKSQKGWGCKGPLRLSWLTTCSGTGTWSPLPRTRQLLSISKDRESILYVFTKFAFCTEKGPRVPAGRQLKMGPLTKRTGMFGVISEGMLNRSVELIKALCTALEGSTLEHFCDGMLIWTEIRAAKSGSEVRKQCLKGLNKPKNGSLSQRRLGSDFIKCMKL